MNPSHEASTRKQLWVLTGGNGSGKTTFYRMFVAPAGLSLINADVIAKAIHPDHPENASYEAAVVAERIREAQLKIGANFCYETVFSHPSKIDFIAKAKGLGYEVILLYFHLDTPQLNEARVLQRVSEGGHNVPIEKILARLPRTLTNVKKAIPLADETRLLDNSSHDNPFRQIAIFKKGRCTWHANPLPEWARPFYGSVSPMNNNR